jgi:putative methyltransferase (TIGR04325 family)
MRHLLILLRLRKPIEQPALEAVEASVDEPSEWEYVPEGWRRPVPGWDVDSVAELYEAKWPAFRRAVSGSGPLAVNHEAPLQDLERHDDLDAHNLIVSFAYVLALAAHGRDAVSLLDWGGGPGHYYVIAKAVAPEIPIEYHSRDLPALCSLGRRLLPDGHFHEDDTCLDRRYDLVMASSSLQYDELWQERLRALAGATARFLYVTRVPLTIEHPSFVVLQRAQRHGYGTEYLGWVLNLGELLGAASTAGFELRREFSLGAQFSAVGAPEDPVGHRGFLFAPTPTLGAH